MIRRQMPGKIDNQRGASLVEFMVIAPAMFLVGLGTLQAGLLYHSNTILNYATYEAARVGATRHAQPIPMRRELGIRLAPIVGGDGSLEKAAIAIGRTSLDVESPLRSSGSLTVPTKLEILSPDVDAFANWGEESLEYINQRVIPNSHLRHQGDEVRGGVTLADANLLKIEVTHAVELQVPIVGKLLAQAMLLLDGNPDHKLHYMSGHFPMKSTATVRMQSEAFEGAIVAARDRPYGGVVAALSDIADDIETAVVDALDGDDDDGTDGLADGGTTGSCDEHGLPVTTGDPDPAPLSCPVSGEVGGTGTC